MVKKIVVTLLFTTILAVGLLSCSGKKREENRVKVVDYEQLEVQFRKEDNTLYIVNFWATWCAPCVKELPHFMELNESFKEQENFKMILVSLDDAERLEDSVKEFVKLYKLETELYLLDDVTRMNEWIPAVDSLWRGSIPATG